MINLSPSERIVITGAGGWLGTELLDLLIQEHGSEHTKASTVLVGSSHREITVSREHSFTINTFEEVKTLDSVVGVVHLAFQTRDRVQKLGLEKYIATNIGITSKAVRIIEQSEPQWIATVSSGAVFSNVTGNLENNVASNPYGFTKRIEETMLRDVATRLGAHIAIGRLWGAIGKNMPINRSYAVSDFIVQAVSNGVISIRSGHEVWRRYCDAQEFMKVLVESAQIFPDTTFDSGGHLIEVGDLANQISDLLPNQPIEIKRPELSTTNRDTYYPRRTEYDELAERLAIPVGDFPSSLVATIRTHLGAIEASAG